MRRRIQHELDSRIAPEVAEYRAIQDATLDALQAVAWNMLDASHDPNVKLKAVDRLIKLMERRAHLHGLDAPVRVDAAVTQQTQAEAELEALLDPQDARNEAIRREIEGT